MRQAKPFKISKQAILDAWHSVRSKHGAQGLDGQTIAQFEEDLRNNLYKLWNRLSSGSYFPPAVRAVEIPKRDGKKRMLGIPTVTDRLIQQAIAQVLVPIFDPGFSDHSCGFRPNRSAHDAVYQVRDYIKEGYRWAVDMDLEKFFDTLHHDVLMHRVARKVRDKRLLKLIGKYLLVNGRLEKTRKGVPQGGPLSPLLANIVLDDLDKELERRGHHFVRYADDFLILVKRQRAGDG
jgi:RNA-directed DNA polymerase